MELGPPPSRGRRLRRTAAVGIAAGALVLGIAGPAAAAEASSFAVSVDVTVLGSPAVTVGPLVASSVGDSPNTLASVTAGGLLTTGVVNTSATADANTGGFTSSASVDNLAATVATLTLGADVISATCTAVQGGNTGTSTLTGLTASLASLPVTIPVNPAANTVVPISVGPIQIATLTLNEQISNPDGGLTVNALHLRLLGAVLGSIATGDVIVSSATCGPAVLPVPMASGIGLYVGLGLVGVTAGVVLVRRRRGRATAAA
jgi:hypothetical protein